MATAEITIRPTKGAKPLELDGPQQSRVRKLIGEGTKSDLSLMDFLEAAENTIKRLKGEAAAHTWDKCRSQYLGQPEPEPNQEIKALSILNRVRSIQGLSMVSDFTLPPPQARDDIKLDQDVSDRFRAIAGKSFDSSATGITFDGMLRVLEYALAAEVSDVEKWAWETARPYYITRDPEQIKAGDAERRRLGKAGTWTLSTVFDPKSAYEQEEDRKQYVKELAAKVSYGYGPRPGPLAIVS